jgi:phosphate/sulfate permease
MALWPRAAFGEPTETWAALAFGFAVAIGLALWGAYVVACVVVQLGAPGGSANLAPFIGFAAFESSVYVLLGTVFVTIPIGCLWVTLLRLLGPNPGLPPSAL